MSASSQGSGRTRNSISVDNLAGITATPTPRKKVANNDEISKQLGLLASQITGLRSEVSSLQSGVSTQIESLRSDMVSNRNELKKLQSIRSPSSPSAGKAKGKPMIDIDELTIGGDIATSLTEASALFDNNNNNNNNNNTAKNSGENINTLFIGDIISMNLSEDGTLFGDIRLDNLGVEHLGNGSGRVGGTTPNDAAFRLCPKLNYRYLLFYGCCCVNIYYFNYRSMCMPPIKYVHTHTPFLSLTKKKYALKKKNVFRTKREASRRVSDLKVHILYANCLYPTPDITSGDH
jgi:hypothetical protein